MGLSEGGQAEDEAGERRVPGEDGELRHEGPLLDLLSETACGLYISSWDNFETLWGGCQQS